MTTVVDGGAPTVTEQPVHQPYKLGPNSARGIKGLAITQIVMGVLCIAFESILVALYHSDLHMGNEINGYIAPGIWNGVIILVIGIIGAVTASQNTRGWIIACMVINIVAAVEMPTFISMTSIATGESVTCGYVWFYYECDTYAHLALNILNLIMAISQFIITIVAACLCCGPACCAHSGRVHTTVIYHGQQQQQATTTMVVGNEAHTFGYSQSGTSQPQYFSTQPHGPAYGYGIQPPEYQQQDYNAQGQPGQQPPAGYYSQVPAYPQKF